MKRILDGVLNQIKPSEKEEKEMLGKIAFLLDQINRGLKDARAILGGSGIKGTWLKKANDADIFVKFDYNTYKDRSSEISDILEEILKKKKLKIIRLHGSRDYFQIKGQGFTYEIIPILGIKKAEQAKNITDVSPLHAEWVNKKGRRLKDDIRLLKQFCKAAGVYGAESYIHGFSGYLCEILVVYYKGFANLIKNAAKWKDDVIIDIENYWKGKNILMELNKSKTYSPMVVIDPVQADRNAAAALSREKFDLFKKGAKEFLKKPSEEFFEINEVDEMVLKQMAGSNHLILIDVLPKQGKDDVVGCKLVKSLEFIKKQLTMGDFNVLDYGWCWNKKAWFYLIVKKERSSSEIKLAGPPVKIERHVKNFKKKYRKTFVENGRICAKVKREFRYPHELIETLKKDDYLKEKINGFKVR